jgi:hypothetical protein
VPPPQPFEFPFDEAATLRTAVSDLKAALDALEDQHVERVEEIRRPTQGGGGPAEMQPVFAGAARQAFDSLFDAAIDAVATVAGDLGTDLEELDGIVGEALVAAAWRDREIEMYRESLVTRPQRDPEAPLGVG